MEFDEYVVDLNADCKCGCMDLHRFHKIYHFPNDYGASVIANPKTSEFEDGGYRVMLIEFDDPQTYSPVRPEGFDKNVVECPNWDTAADVLRRVIAL